MAAEKGQMDAQCELGRRYESGHGVSRNISQAKQWYQAAASKGSKTAERNLRRLYGQENVAVGAKASAQSRGEREDAAKVEQESEKLRELRNEVANLKKSLAQGGGGISVHESARPLGRQAPSLSGRSSVRFTMEDAETLSQLEFSSPVAKSHYQKACSLAREGAHNKAKVKAEYNNGRSWGGPEWPELEAWLDWWK